MIPFCALHKESIFRSLTTISKYFDRTFQYNVGKRQREGLGVRISKYQKPHNHRTGQITRQRFLTFLRPGLGRWGGGGVLPGPIWQELLKVDGVDLSPSLLSTMTRFSTTDIHPYMLTSASILPALLLFPKNTHVKHQKREKRIYHPETLICRSVILSAKDLNYQLNCQTPNRGQKRQLNVFEHSF